MLKSLLASRTVWGLILSVLATTLSKYGIDVGAQLQSQIVDVAVGVIGVIGVGLTATGPAVQAVAKTEGGVGNGA